MTNLLLFLPAALVLVAIPGPNHLYITARSIGEGRRAGLASAFGVETGTLVHIAAAAAGLSALVAASATAFGVLRYAGAAYLVYLAYRTLRGGGDGDGPALRPQPLRRVYLDGVLVNVLNPKVVLFFLAFLPQFVDRRAGAVPLQIALMGLMVVLFGLLSDIAYALAAGSIGTWLRARPAFRRRQRYATGLVYLGLGAAAVFAAPARRA
ncbi:threonine/homoserine/homoserine lactone efflux protein [Actinomadura hallensis]|uniref:Threonine/homoserine/homoserine lactone efflux protein n=1 Tax=Actinomadura hallensis TaxID=337895 RepID=A0A543IKV0_9ACTN|nr:LysE family translocator [Actinomadura hallensis]TQM71210.1 threonine/homoserine/homoserine lactone efflux protein [Actinomadura hallensis]